MVLDNISTESFVGGEAGMLATWPSLEGMELKDVTFIGQSFMWALSDQIQSWGDLLVGLGGVFGRQLMLTISVQFPHEGLWRTLLMATQGHE